VGNLLLVFHFSIRFVVGLSEMWESCSDFQGLWEAGCAFHQSVISTGKALFGRDFGFRFLGLLDAVARDVQLDQQVLHKQSRSGEVNAATSRD
jgi:hypothetical protein